MSEKKEFKGTIRKWGLPSFLVVLTIGLMIFFKLSSQSFEALQDEGKNLVAEYTSNLKPLNSKTELTNDDVLNFAYRNILPIDKDNNKSLRINPGTDGEELLLVKEESGPKDDIKFSEYISDLDYSDNERTAVDSILNSYRVILNKSIYYDNNNVVAVDPNISILHKKLNNDLLRYSFNKYTSGKHLSELASLANSPVPGIDADWKDFIVIAPDTAFECELQVIDDADLSSPVIRPVKTTKVSEVNKVAHINKKFQFSFQSDSTLFKLQIPKEYYSSKGVYDLDSISHQLELAAKELNNFSIKYNLPLAEGKFGVQFQSVDGDSLSNAQINVDFGMLSKLIGTSVGTAISGLSKGDWNNFGIKLDSLTRLAESLENDSTSIRKLREVTRKLEQLRKEREKYKRN